MPIRQISLTQYTFVLSSSWGKSLHPLLKLCLCNIFLRSAPAEKIRASKHRNLRSVSNTDLRNAIHFYNWTRHPMCAVFEQPMIIWIRCINLHIIRPFVGACTTDARWICRLSASVVVICQHEALVKHGRCVVINRYYKLYRPNVFVCAKSNHHIRSASRDF